jgi:PKD repeat protein
MKRHALFAARLIGLAVLCATGTVHAQQWPNLTNQNPSARFTLTDRVWAANPGDASICLWADDKLAAINVSVDDNSASNIDWWLTQSAAYGFPVTWFIVTENVGKSLDGGTWALWNKVQSLGHEVQSHTMNHLNTNSATWVDIDTEYWGSQLAIETNMPGHKCDFLAYAGGANQYLNNRTNAAKYYAANRGGGGAISAANKIDYFAPGTMSSYNLSTPNTWSYLPILLTNTTGNFRGLACQLWHWISPTNYVSVQPFLDFVDANRAALWVGRFSDIAKYGQERDTATLTTNENSSTRIALTLTDQMLDSRFNNPLTLKVRLPAAWSNVQVSQNGQPIASRVLAYNGGNYALVQAVPDQGEIALITSAANFTAAPASGWTPLPVTFTDTSSGVITNRFWDFGDGATSNTTASSVTHTYTTGGVYTVQLIASGPDGASTNTQVDCIRATTPIVPFANFIAAPTNGLAPLPVFFTETSTGSITNRFWDFGDGTTTNTTATSVTHTYASAGTNTVKLIVSGPAGVSTNTQTNRIKVTGTVALSAGFTASPTNGSAPLLVSFSDTSTGNITNRFWDFGDGATTNTTATGITHTYTVAGTNTVQLIVSGPDGSSTNTQIAAVTVTVPAPPSASFSASSVSGTAPLAVSFTDTSTGSITNRFWSFGDGATTNTMATSVSHTYTVAGTNTVQLVVRGPAGASTNTKPNLISVAAAVVPTGSLIVYDPFNDAVQTNSAVPSSVPSTWSTAAVIPNPTRASDNHSQITAGSLSYPGLQASAGNSWTTYQGFDDYSKDVSGVSGLVAGGAVYYSFLLKVNPSDAVSQYYMRLYNTANIFSSGLAFGVGLSADLTQIGFSLSSRNGNFSTAESSSVAHTGFDYNSSNTFLVVLGYRRGTTAANSSMNLWINPDSSTFGTATPPAPVLTLVGYNYAQEAIWNKLEYIFNGSGTGTAAGETIDEFRIALDWASAVPAAISAPSGDADSDGLPNDWESQYFGGATNANANALAANGVNTILESYIAGLNPTNPASVLLISDFRPPTSASILQWQSASGRVYSVYWTTNLLNGFQPLATNMVWPQSSWTDAVHGAQAGGFYRIDVRLNP